MFLVAETILEYQKYQGELHMPNLGRVFPIYINVGPDSEEIILLKDGRFHDNLFYLK